MNIPSKYLWLTGAIIAGGVGALVTKPHSNAITSAHLAVAATNPVSEQPEQALGVHAAARQETADDQIQGKVVETISVPNYTYLRLSLTRPNKSSTAGDIWAAVPTADVKVGQVVTVVGAQRMDGFTSSTLKRTFESIYFGSLEDTAKASDTKLPPGHPDIGAGPRGAATEPSVMPPHGATQDMMPGQHGSPTAGGDQVAVGKVDRASGALGHTVSEVVNGRSQLVGKKVRVHGVVVKSTSGVLGKTFLHLRDGSGNPASGDHDLAVTTVQQVTVGSTILVEGTVITDKDFGSGYTYRVLVEDARVVSE